MGRPRREGLELELEQGHPDVERKGRAAWRKRRGGTGMEREEREGTGMRRVERQRREEARAACGLQPLCCALARRHKANMIFVVCLSCVTQQSFDKRYTIKKGTRQTYSFP